MNILGARTLPALPRVASVTGDAQARVIPVFGADIAEDPTEILGDPWSHPHQSSVSAPGALAGLNPLARLKRRKH